MLLIALPGLAGHGALCRCGDRATRSRSPDPLRRRFFRGTGRTESRTEVEIDRAPDRPRESADVFRQSQDSLAQCC